MAAVAVLRGQVRDGGDQGLLCIVQLSQPNDTHTLPALGPHPHSHRQRLTPSHPYGSLHPWLACRGRLQRLLRLL